MLLDGREKVKKAEKATLDDRPGIISRISGKGSKAPRGLFEYTLRLDTAEGEERRPARFCDKDS